MKDLKHPNVLHLLAVAKKDLPNGDYDIMIVTPYMANGDLKTYLENNNQQVEDQVSKAVSIK